MGRTTYWGTNDLGQATVYEKEMGMAKVTEYQCEDRHMNTMRTPLLECTNEGDLRGALGGQNVVMKKMGHWKRNARMQGMETLGEEVSGVQASRGDGRKKYKRDQGGGCCGNGEQVAK